jgi:iron complex outermembrane receptor protein
MAGALADDGSYRLYAKVVDRDASLSPSGSDAYDAWSTYRGGFRADWGDRFTIQGDAFHVDADYMRANFPLAPPFLAIHQQTIKYDGANLLGRWTDARSDGSRLTVQTYVDWARGTKPFNFVDDRLIIDLEAQYNVIFGRHELVLGGGYRFAHATDDSYVESDVTFSPDQRNDSIFNAYVQDKIELVPEHWFLTLGTKVEHNPFTGFEIQRTAGFTGNR